MRIWMLALAVLVVAITLTIARDEVGRVAIIVFFTGLVMVAAGLTAVMALFQTVGAMGESKDILAGIEALAATVVVLFVGSATVLGVLFCGGLLLRWAIP